MDAGGVNSGSPKIVEQERSGVLLKLMDAMGYSLLNLTAGDIALMGKGFLKETAILSANFQGQNASFRVLREFDHTDAQGRKFRFFGAYDGPDPRFSSAREWLAAATLPADRTCVLLYYADRQPDAETKGFLKKFDAVIANVNLPEDVPAFVPLAKGKQVAVLSVQDKKRVSGRDILVDEHVIGDPEMLDLAWREQSALSKRVDELERTQYLRMSPEEFIKSYQKESQ
ncbi:hypothetical protein AXF15_05370 [Desulfomicrobium orale DSM 12838]|uniref:Uncharacterized protein n=1 Tax=Desulfomicrobium orale DSM 12838 TaxID=888061 RepID=A0A120KN01_9BACT|nr:hypothetical protein AXF15_05370 [Desulfomicrobium orale DSM 12838]